MERTHLAKLSLLAVSILLPLSTSSSLHSDRQPSGLSDGDVCCKTIVKYFMNRTMTDVRGKKQIIAQTKDIGSNQLIRHAYCGEGGICPGKCEIVNIYMSLLTVQDEDKQPLKTAWFELPGYCSCRVKKDQTGR